MIRLDAAGWVRIGAAAFVLAAVAASAAQMGRNEEGAPPAPLAPSASIDPLALELERCRRLTPEAPPDEACERVWTKVRQRFFAEPEVTGAREP